MFPGLVNLAIIVYSCFPRLFRAAAAGSSPRPTCRCRPRGWIMVFIYAWLGVSLAVAYLAKAVEPRRAGRFLGAVLVYIAGYGSLLCACTFASYVKELRRAEMTWDKTEKTGRWRSRHDGRASAGPAPRPARGRSAPASIRRSGGGPRGRYERGLVVKAAAVLAVLAVIVVLRTLYFA